MDIPLWTAIVLAGQRPGVDRLAAHFGMTWKALTPIAGRPMIARVVETLLAVPAIGRVVIVAQEPAVFAAALPDDPRIATFTSGSGISLGIAAAAGGAAPWPVLVTTADHPLLTPDMVTAFLAGVGEADLAIGAVERGVLLAAHPGNQRTWLKFLDGWWSGANLFALRTPRTKAALLLWAEAEQDRKRAFRLFWHFGPVLALRAITRTIGFARAIRVAGRRLGLSARLVPLRQAEAAIDVDKPSDHALAESILRGRAGAD